jgi:hypothetical protein
VRYGQTQGPDTGTTTRKGADAEIELASKNHDAYLRAKENGHDDWVKIAQKSDAYFVGEQWERNVADQLDQEGRPHVTINQVLSTVNAILSEHVRTRQEITFSPRAQGATEPVSVALSKVVKQIQYNNESKWVEQQVVADGIIEDRGYFDIRIDFSDNIFGEVRELAIDPRDILLDPGAKDYDPATWMSVTRTRWLTPDQIAVFYGEAKAEQLRNRAVSQRMSADSIEWDSGTRTFGEDAEYAYIYNDEDLRAVKRVRIIERQHKQFARCKYFVDPVEGDMVRVPGGWDEVKAASHALMFDLEILEKPELRIRWTTSADDVLLYDDWSLYNRFTIIPFFPYFRRGKPTGLVRHLISPQDMLNKITSQELHVVNTTANSGWIFESGSLVNMDADDLEQIGAKTGLVLEFKRGSTPPEKIQPNQIPTGLDNIATKAQIYFRNVSGISETMVGQQSREISGVAIDNLNSAGASGLDIVWDNLSKTRQWRAEFYLELIQQWYTERRVLQITQLDEDGNEQTEELIVNNDESPEGELINNLSLGEYATIVTSQKSRDATMDAEFAQMIEMRNAGLAIPDWAIVQVSRLENKAEIVEVMKKVQGMAEPTPEEVEMQMMQQQLMLQTQSAQLGDLIAGSKLKEAQAMLAMAKADAAGQQLMLDSQKEGVRMRTELEKIQGELTKTIHELQTRLVISREKNETIRFQAQAQSMNKRLDTMAKRQTDLLGIAQKARAERNKPKPANK